MTIDFGSNVWTGTTNWLQIGVETNGGGGLYGDESARDRKHPPEGWTPCALRKREIGNCYLDVAAWGSKPISDLILVRLFSAYRPC